LAGEGLGQVLDIVPNHMSIACVHNSWWWDVLRRGRSSWFARYFDVYWTAPADAFRVLVPILGTHYGKALGDIKLDRQGRAIVVRYFDHVLPLSPQSTHEIVSSVHASDVHFGRELDRRLDEINRDPQRLDAVLGKQHYRLAFWRYAATDLNY